MTSQAIVERIQSRFGEAVIEAVAEGLHPRVHINGSTWRELATFLKNDNELSFDWLSCLGGMDYVASDQLAIVVDLYSTWHKHLFAVKVFTPREDKHLPSVTDLWAAANWQEREAFDMFGLVFDGHPDFRRILLEDNWIGYPLLKDYVFPREVNGIPGSVELDWQQKPSGKK
ncbi:MAG TPA: NADH-quinone oxidoreductase subunit C [Tepidisphaeraceae bacterium]|jgi:NADH-quinone oxidoreductase subunit C